MRRFIALLALVGWSWLLIEPWLRRRIEQRKPRMGNLVVNFVSQSLQQELLFFSLPLLIGATQLDAGQIAFTGLAAAAALLSTIDPLYERYVATRAARRLLFHAYCSWIAALVVLPMVLLLPLERALPVSLAAVGVWLVATLPLSLHSLQSVGRKTAWIAALIVVPILLWALRGQVPAAGLAVTEARITQSIDELTPGAAVRTLAPADLTRGVIAFAAIRAPAGLAQEVIFEWRHNGERERPHSDRGPVGEFGAARSGGRSHEGFDIVAACGTKLVAARKGKVLVNRFDPVLDGNELVIHARGAGRNYRYSHLRKPGLPEVGEVVETGERIGSVRQDRQRGHGRLPPALRDAGRRAPGRPRAGPAALGRETARRRIRQACAQLQVLGAHRSNERRNRQTSDPAGAPSPLSLKRWLASTDQPEEGSPWHARQTQTSSSSAASAASRSARSRS